MAAEKGTTKTDEQSGGFATFVWNPQTKQFLGRSGTSWLKVTVFYIIFYICLAAFWALMLFLFRQTISQDYPKWQLGDSRIGTNPGLGFRPRPPEEKIDSTLISFSTGPQGNWKHWVDNLDSFLKPYTSDSPDSLDRGAKIASADECSKGKPLSNEDQFCAFNYKDQLSTDACNSANKYGYEKGEPCVLIKLNRIYGWKPEILTEKPKELANYTGSLDGIIITCDGENAADREIIGPVRYAASSQVIKANYFPYRKQAGYASPFVMVQFTRVQRGTLVNVECRAWAKNIKYDRAEREGSVKFELLID